MCKYHLTVLLLIFVMACGIPTVATISRISRIPHSHRAVLGQIITLHELYNRPVGIYLKVERMKQNPSVHFATIEETTQVWVTARSVPIQIL